MATVFGELSRIRGKPLELHLPEDGIMLMFNPKLMEKVFGNVLMNAFKYGAPPHAGCAPGVDRTVMLLADEPSIREVILFPMNGKAQDLMMQAPNTVTEQQLKELHIQIVKD